MAFALLAVANGEAQGFRIRDEAKLHEVAGYMGIKVDGRPVNDIARDVAETALGEFGKQTGELVYLSRATAARQELWHEQKIAPRGIDREVVEMMHRTHMGVDQDAENILDQVLCTSLTDGWGGSMLATDISDILFGTPAPLQSQVNLGVLKDDEVNLVVHGHDPLLSEMIVAASTDPELLEYAKSKGANGHQPGRHLLHGQRDPHAPRHPPRGQLPFPGTGHRDRRGRGDGRRRAVHHAGAGRRRRPTTTPN